jgi:PhnB protein
MTAITTSIQPWISVNNSAAAGKFYQEAFKAIETYRMETPDGGLVLKFSIDAAEFWVSGQSKDTDTTSVVNLRQDALRLILVVADPDATFQQAIKAGASEVFPVGEDFGWRLGRITDPFGIDWEIGKPLNKE